MQHLSFENLTPETILAIIEESTGLLLSGFAASYPSYINRVYELKTRDGESLIAKFYRPGRWSRGALLDEHRFIQDCAESDIPVVSPLPLHKGQTLGEFSGLHFALFPKRGGRPLELESDEMYLRVGGLLGRMHSVGAARQAPARINLTPLTSTQEDIEQLLLGGFIPSPQDSDFAKIANGIVELIAPLFEDAETMRIHGDFHRGNILMRPEEGLMLIDFDDMANGPPVQDLWLLLPDYAENSRHEIKLLLDGYCQFRDFDDSSLCLIEPLRAMRIIYFLAWCAKQSADFRFRHNFPDWGTPVFWRKEINDLKSQFEVIKKGLAFKSRH